MQCRFAFTLSPFFAFVAFLLVLIHRCLGIAVVVECHKDVEEFIVAVIGRADADNEVEVVAGSLLKIHAQQYAVVVKLLGQCRCEVGLGKLLFKEYGAVGTLDYQRDLVVGVGHVVVLHLTQGARWLSEYGIGVAGSTNPFEASVKFLVRHLLLLWLWFVNNLLDDDLFRLFLLLARCHDGSHKHGAEC